MAREDSILTGKRILAVDDEPDILETIRDIIFMANLDEARDYETASKMIKKNQYDLVILDIMGVNGLVLLEESVKQGFPTVMLTAHAINPETLMESIHKGAISYLPKETLSELDEHLGDLLSAFEKGEPPWKMLFEKLDSYFNERFGPDWKEKHQAFWSEFDATYEIGKGVQQRLKNNKEYIIKGI
ncbi:MAG: response regulator [Deltaproteobacteria bacterium]|jgi:response regulator of citrate/malate metabolism|nr:response regulator [Deltaproteobacteria bacterium]MBT4644217.1 response regulator [Deltaproteobacteria bacterium]MBT6614543.1 response regulator [Deltaproteobacteria bacterium]MBT7154712.1 response regulator [Deltaproteobacteria bacterium]MBT7714488.1 response regulator [Deltaproteobacteria bacterium]